MDSGTTPPQDDGQTADVDEVDIRPPDDPRVPRPDDADPAVSKELGGAAPAVGPGSLRQEGPATRRDPDDGEARRRITS